MGTVQEGGVCEDPMDCAVGKLCQFDGWHRTLHNGATRAIHARTVPNSVSNLKVWRIARRFLALVALLRAAAQTITETTEIVVTMVVARGRWPMGQTVIWAENQ